MPLPKSQSPFPTHEQWLAADAPTTASGQHLGVEPLEGFFARHPRFAVAFSGGTDSAYLLAAAKQAGCAVGAYMVKTAFQPQFEYDDAQAVARALNVPLTVIEADVLAQEDICRNPAQRCYLCKRFIFAQLGQAATRDGFPVIADGTNGTDDPARRPGFQALAEAGVISPLRRAGLSKANVRHRLLTLERELGLPPNSLKSEKPSFPCLAVFVPEGAPINEASLAKAKKARDL